MRRHHALVEDDAVLGVDAGGDVGRRDLARRICATRPGPAAASARADRRCRRCTRNRAAARPSCGSRRDNCRDAGCRSAGCRKKSVHGGAVIAAAGRRSSRAAQIAPPGHAEHEDQRPRRSRRRRRSARKRRRGAARVAPARAGASTTRSATSAAPMPIAREGDARQVGARAAVEPEMPAPRQQVSSVKRLHPARHRQRDRDADMREGLHQEERQRRDSSPSTRSPS